LGGPCKASWTGILINSSNWLRRTGDAGLRFTQPVGCALDRFPDLSPDIQRRRFKIADMFDRIGERLGFWVISAAPSRQKDDFAIY
jgi:hypothetical protein